ncbi:MAG: XTP/dITP diphosphatase [Nitrososphaerota archaeon]|nr:XTP/dITP diphosphatase [Nitrososphaerales archaeon]MDW8045137.1 XTP/dITP diphosphatase [Nitrososphaerota archaeon]
MCNDTKRVYFATSNIHKFREVKSILSQYGIDVVMVKGKLLEVQSESLVKIATQSIYNALKVGTKTPLILEDSGLFIRSLNGFPGPYSSYVYRTIGLKGILKILEGVEDRYAEFKSVIAFADKFMNIKSFVGVVKGEISQEERGIYGFGFDPIFIPYHSSKTFGEMLPQEKNKYSHRAKALIKFVKWFMRANM